MKKELSKIKNDLQNWDKRREIELAKEIQKTEPLRKAIDWSKTDWKQEVIKNYEKLYETQFKHPSLKFLNHGLKISIVGLIERPDYRVYTIISPWMIDVIVEFMISLKKKQIKKLDKELGTTQLCPMTNEKSRFISAGTSLTDKYNIESAERTGKFWADQVAHKVDRILYSDIHKM